MVCGWGATKTGHKTGVAQIEAGGTIGFRAFAATYNPGFVPTREVSSICSPFFGAPLAVGRMNTNAV